MALEDYRRKRRPGRTPEPPGEPDQADGDGRPVFVIQRHDARRLHYDLRLEMGGVLASWALPKGLPLEPGERYLAVHTEDHPMKYATFAGVIPKGEYGAGTMEIWDHGVYELVEQKRDGGLTVRLEGDRVQGLWTLVPARLGGDEKNWLVIKKHDPGGAAERSVRAAYAPMLATQSDRLPGRGDWTYEVKWDGYRVIARLEGGETALTSRRGVDMASRFPMLVRALPHALRTSDCVVDGELCMLDEEGRPSFSLMQRGEGSPAYYVFDLLELERRPIIDLPLEERREQLEALLIDGNPLVRLSRGFDDGAALLDAVVAQDMEGVVAKRLGSPYRPGRRSGDWVKVKSRQDGEFLILGWTPGQGAREALGSLVLGEPGDEGITWAGNVGSGLDERTIAELLRRLEPMRVDAAPISPLPKMPKTPVRRVRWVEPRLRAKVRFAERTRDGRLRAPVFMGLAEEQAQAEVRSSRVTLTNPAKVFFPDDGITKGDVFAYYMAVADAVVPHMRDRPFTMLRYPDGIEGKSFFQKNAPDHLPSWIRTFTHEDIRYILVNDADTLAWVVNMGCIDLHPWLARCDRPDRPDLVMFDLDPADGVPFATVAEVALLVREALRALKLQGVPRTSGGKGIHILVPVERRYDHDQARAFVAAVARALARTHPELITTKWRRSDRHGVLIDANQNGLGRTTSAAYSVRPRPGATVATPLAWDELTPDLDPKAFTMEAVMERVSRLGDLAEPLLGRRQRLP
ncbi:MAG TPA: DNA ligase D [Gaiellales bacterium]|jgi:bifunctional non-homologous end joining protein LigD